ncbi:HNH endonuclease [Cohnella fermenti]|uniref:HNH endonuclease n=1 Tax=Cohnella fermenti TaxID=2565925 RepID=A0A4S4BSR3_9BACL|nr:HNH endonuclease [Cohnella fermenti]THF77540.1 HNH endonuclease [Cohnella fermenti]
MVPFTAVLSEVSKESLKEAGKEGAKETAKEGVGGGKSSVPEFAKGAKAETITSFEAADKPVRPVGAEAKSGAIERGYSSEVIESLSAEVEKLPENECFSTYEERIQQTPTDKNTERGYWEGSRGESKYLSSEENINDLLAKYGVEGIKYRDGIPDFSTCSESTVQIDNMSEKRDVNFRQADEKCAEQWNSESKDGKNDWTARDIANWRRENGYSWHECNDRKTCQLIPTEINDYFGHFGGVGECKKANLQEEGFDE